MIELPASGALRWRLSTTLEKRQDPDQADLIDVANQMVLLVGRAELYRAVARLADLNLDYEAAAGLLERAVAVTPNNAAAHQALGRAYLENGRETEAYADLVIALLIDPDAAGTLTELGRWHLSAARPARAIELVERAVASEPTNAVAVRTLADALVRAGRTADGKQRLAEFDLHIRLNLGRGHSVVYACDLSEAYVDFNKGDISNPKALGG